MSISANSMRISDNIFISDVKSGMLLVKGFRVIKADYTKSQVHQGLSWPDLLTKMTILTSPTGIARSLEGRNELIV